jgi:bifunctional UDP-N-acetylglucosamine pyrophosphorylase/glucosamine-1-phosphate N-acetyltransferase
LHVIVLAAGQGKRMRSSLPKVLQPVGGRALLAHVLAVARALRPAAVHVVYGHGGEQVRQAFGQEPDLHWVHQAEQRGTGHAVRLALAAGRVPDDAQILVLYGDVPLVREETLRRLLKAAAAADRGRGALGLLTARLADPSGYGRVLRDAEGRVVGIVEDRDASESQKLLQEINTGILTAPAARLRAWVECLTADNAQGEYYLTDAIRHAHREDMPIVTEAPAAIAEILGVNSKGELARVERLYQHQQAEALMAQGVTVRDPARLDVRGEVVCGRDVIIDVGVILEGRVVIGDEVYIGPYSILRDTTIGSGSQILPHCVIEGAEIGARCRIGPFARLRPGTRLAEGVHVGNFVEVKNAEVGEGAKMNHLSYIGDASVGAHTNIGAGTITCNYDGANKHRTVIGTNAFIGSNTALVAPVRVGDGATIGAGSVITRDAPDGELTLARAEQKTIKGWKRPVKKGTADEGRGRNE